MNINPEGPYRAGQSVPVAPSIADGPTRPRAEGRQGLPDDSLSFSAHATTFLSARARLEGAPQPSRAERIEELAGLVAGGAYTVDGEAVAGAMLADESTARMLGFGLAR